MRGSPNAAQRPPDEGASDRDAGPLTLREIEAMFRTLFERSPDGVLVSSPDGTVLRANPTACRLLGRTEEELCRVGRSGLVVPDPRLATMLAERERSGVVHGELAFQRPDGTTFPAEVTSAIIPTRTAERYAYIVFRDATERRRAEEQTRRQNAVVAGIARVLQEALGCETEEELGRVCLAVAREVTGSRCGFVADVEPEGSRLRVVACGDDLREGIRARSPAGQERCLPVELALDGDRGRALLAGKGFYTNAPGAPPEPLVAAPGGPPLRAFLAVPLRHGGATVGVIALCDREGGYRPEDLAAIEALAPAVAQAFIGKRAQAALRESEARFRAVFEQAAVGLARVGLDGRFLEVNAPLAELVGYTVPELEALSFPAITHPDDLEADLDHARRLLAGELRTYSMEKRYVRKDGTPVWVSLTGSLTRDAQGQPAYFVAVVKDVRERKRFEAALLEADRRKSEFLAVLSHELRNPLTPIRNSVYLLDQAPPTSPQAARAKAVIRRQTDHLARLVDDLLDVTRISRGKIAIDRQRLDLAGVLRRTCDDHRSIFDQAGVALEAELPGGAAWVEADATRMAQVVGNLLQNAVKFTPAGGRVNVGLRVAAGEVVIAVRDDGVGIAAADLDWVFEPFAQADQSLARTSGGLGLGLALVKGLVELHGGAVRARSAGRGLGAEFTVTLPAAAAPGAAGHR